ncbi:hypothetical protein P0082_00020 [Candidatus Haliotispira prima]|uniref:Alginate export domain-containing protein n=1 Tax=Candidatus Haliotispira prima TaxID=3034016 RepID=A0ABY8MJ87_9SPIO|nr:hypothetical protein P0082_12460 [Candidatus Haliotispira prima]WGK69277.1 hypothetical protein P0082_00020 [Candidatus Haliotispira prima]
MALSAAGVFSLSAQSSESAESSRSTENVQSESPDSTGADPEQADLSEFEQVFDEQAGRLVTGTGTESTPVSGTEVRASFPKLQYWLQLELFSGFSWNEKAPDEGQTDQRGLSNLRGLLDASARLELSDSWSLSGKLRFFYDAAFFLKGSDSYSSDFLSENAYGIDVTELFLVGVVFPFWTVKVGKDFVGWGDSQYLAVLDEISPFDRRMPGVAEYKENRLAVLQWQNQFSRKHLKLGTYVFLSPTQDQLPTSGSPFYHGGTGQKNETPAAFEPEFALDLSLWTTSFDLSFVYAYYYRRQPYAAGVPGNLSLKYARKHLAGLSASLSVWQLVLRSEWAFHLDETYPRDFVDVDHVTRLVGLAGIDFFIPVLSESLISLEFRYTNLFAPYSEEQEALPYNPRQEQLNWAVGTEIGLLHAKLKLRAQVLSNGILFNDGGLLRLGATYDLTDHWSISGGAVFYMNGTDDRNTNVAEDQYVFAKLTLQT